MNEEFYMCFVEGGYSPSKKHETYEQAVAEAQRLAQKENKSVYVLGTACKVTCKSTFEIEEL